jgi:hypothetical protein
MTRGGLGVCLAAAEICCGLFGAMFFDYKELQ